MAISTASRAGYHEDPELPGYWLYDGLRIQANVEVHQFVVKQARESLAPGARILDVAAGEGALTKQLLDAGFDLSCTSWNDKVRANVPSYRVDLDVPFSPSDVGNQLYDMVCAIEIIEHIENPAAFLRACGSVLAPGGTLVLSTPNVENAASRLQWLLRGCPAIFSDHEVRTNRHIAMMWRQGLEFLIEHAGYDTVAKHFLGRTPLRKTPGAMVKRFVYWLLETFTEGETKGASRVYVLRQAKPVQRVGPEDVF